MLIWVLRSFSNGPCYEHHLFYLTDWGFYPPWVASPNHLCDIILGPGKSLFPARRSQGASMLELNLFAFRQPHHLFQIWILRVAQNWLVSTLQSNPTRDNGTGKKISFIFFCPMAVTHPNTNQSHRCLTSVTSLELVCQHGYSIAPILCQCTSL